MNKPDSPPLRIGQIALNVHDVSRVADYYQTVVGLEVLTLDQASVTLGVGSTTLLTLYSDPSLPLGSPRDAGLFHTAFLLPTRADLGRWLAHAYRDGVHLDGAADHRVIEAVYLHDPEGNGIEIYADRPRSDWHYTNGRVEMANEPLDFNGLAASAGTGLWQGLPKNSTVGHVHLQVGAIEPAEAFYGPLLGFDLTCRYPGGSFFSTGGYHHHLAANVWNSLGAAERSEPTTGLAYVDIVAATQSVVDAVHQRVTRVQPIAQLADGTLWLRDPWGTRLHVSLDN